MKSRVTFARRFESFLELPPYPDVSSRSKESEANLGEPVHGVGLAAATEIISLRKISEQKNPANN